MSLRTPAEHYYAAQETLDRAAEADDHEAETYWLQRALVHATLALYRSTP